MRRLLFLLVLLAPVGIHAQEPGLSSPVVSQAEDVQFVEAASGTFHRAVLQAARKQVRDGIIPRRDALKLRVALLSPAYRAYAEDLAVTQMAFSGSDAVPMSDNGMVERTAIQWGNLADFIERLIPLLIQLLEIFGVA